MEEGDRKELISRIGTFFLLVGLMILVLFIASDVGAETQFLYFFIAVMMLLTGWYFKRSTAPAPKPGSRFEGLRKLRQKQKDAKAKREADKKKKK